MSTSRAHLDRSPAFWDVLAPYHAAIENNYLDLPTLRALRRELRDPVLVVGAGQGLLVSELRRQGLRCDGVDLSAAMIRWAKVRRDLTLVQADAKALPFADHSYATVIYATGVVDCVGDEREIRAILEEGRRIARGDGSIFVAFYRLSMPLADFLRTVGLLRGDVLDERACLELYLHDPLQTTAWVAKRAGTSRLGAARLLLRLWIRSPRREKVMSSAIGRIVKSLASPRGFVEATPATQPYRDEVAIRALFRRLEVPVRQLRAFEGCFVVQVVRERWSVAASSTDRDLD